MRNEMKDRTFMGWVAVGFIVLLLLVLNVARANGADKVTICHAAGQADTTKHVTERVGHKAAYGPAGHFNEDGTTRAGHEDDYLGACSIEGEGTTTTTEGTTTTSHATTTTTTQAVEDTSTTSTTAETPTMDEPATSIVEPPTTTVQPPTDQTPATTEVTPEPAKELPYTGSDNAILATIGLLLIAAGTTLAVMTRKGNEYKS